MNYGQGLTQQQDEREKLQQIRPLLHIPMNSLKAI
jgi:hypothetical protein